MPCATSPISPISAARPIFSLCIPRSAWRRIGIFLRWPAMPVASNTFRPGSARWGNWIAEFLAAKEKIKLVHVAYKGGGQAVLDLLAGHVKVGMLTWSTVGGHV